MKSYPALRRCLAALLTLVSIAAVLAGVSWSRSGGAGSKAPSEESKASRVHAMFGGSVQRNMVNTVEKNMPTDWDVKTGKGIKWVAELGSKAYGGPVISGGKIFIGTNNDRPRNPRDTNK